MIDPVVHSVCARLQRRSELGQVKYGKLLTRDDLSRLDWLHHLQQELLDAALYVERLIREETIHQPEADDAE